MHPLRPNPLRVPSRHHASSRWQLQTASSAHTSRSGTTAQLLHTGVGPPRDTLERIARGDGRFVRFCDMFVKASASNDILERRRVLDYFNDHLGPELRTEESALQLLVMRMVHLKLETGWRVRLNVQRNLSGTAVTHVARDYRIRDIFSHPKGGMGIVIDPEDARSKQASIILFRGTAARNSRDILARTAYPSGGLDDIHHRGVGHVGARNLGGWFAQHADRVLGEGRRLMLVGHSLGGAYALKLFSTLSPAQQEKTHALVFCAPGITWSEAKAIVAPARNTRMIFHRWDPVSLAGVAFPPCMQATIHDTISRGPHGIPHGSPQLSIREGRGDSLRKSISPYTQKPRFSFNLASIVAEPVRILGGRIIRHLLRD